MNASCLCIVLAAGEGTRMKSATPKVLHEVGHRPMIERVLSTCPQGERPIVVVGHAKEAVMAGIQTPVHFVEQAQRLGTGHAVMMAMDFLKQHEGYTLVLAGDMPLMTKDTVDALIEAAQGNAASLLVAVAEDPTGYGRILRDESGNVTGIVEHKDATPEQRAIRETNASVYCFDTQALCGCLAQLTCDNVQGEYYLTDCIALLVNQGRRVVAVEASMETCMGVNDRRQLATAEGILRRRVNDAHMAAGVTMIDPQTTYIDEAVVIGRDTLIEGGARLFGATVVGERCHIAGNTRLLNATLGDDVVVENSVLCDCSVGHRTTVGPFAYLRPHSAVGEDCKVGDFVEIKNATIGNGTKMSHLSYIGDAQVGAHVNIACGVTFANYDGKLKQTTVVEDDCFIGCNVNLIAPVHIGKGAYVAAGTTVTKPVSQDALAIGRVQQEEKANWARQRREQGRL